MGEAFHLGPEYGSVSVMASNLEQDGVWAWASEYPTKSMDDAQSRVFHYTKVGGLQSWPLGHDRSVLAGSVANPSLAACGADAWLGINWRLFKIDPDKGIVGSWDIPQIAQNQELTEQVPPAAKAFTEHTLIRDMSCHDGTVALAIWHGTSALVFDAATGSFHSVALPDDEVAVSAAVAANGTVAFGLQSTGTAGPHDVLVYLPKTGKLKTVAVDSSIPIQALPGDGSAPQFSTAHGAQTIDVGTDLVTLSVARSGAAIPVNSLDPYRSSVAYLADGRSVAPSSQGIAIAGPQGLDRQLINLGSRPCGFSDASPHARSEPGAPSSTQDPDARCPIGTDLVTVDASGTIWYPGYLGDGSTVPVLWATAPPS